MHSISSTRENVSHNSAILQFRSGTTEISSAFDQFTRENVSRNSVIPQWNNGNFICFQYVSLDKMFPAIPLSRNSGIPQRNNGNFICFQSVSLEKMFPAVPLSRKSAAERRKFHLLSISSDRENVSRNSAAEQRELSHFPFFRCPVFPYFSRTRANDKLTQTRPPYRKQSRVLKWQFVMRKGTSTITVLDPICVIIDLRLNWVLHTANAVKTVASSSFALYKLKRYLDENLLCKVYFSVVPCHLHNAILTWGISNTTLLDRLIQLCPIEIPYWAKKLPLSL